MGSETYDLQNIIVKGAADNGATIQVLDPTTGSWKNGKYYWWNEDKTMGYPAGWFDDGGNEKEPINLVPGQGVFFSTTASGVSLQFAGEVSSDATANVPVGGAVVGNLTPCQCKLSQVVLGGTAVADNSVTIQVLDPDTGAWKNGKYYWWNEDTTMGYPAGWFDDGGNEKPDITLEPGDSVFISTKTSGVTLKFPKVINNN